MKYPKYAKLHHFSLNKQYIGKIIKATEKGLTTEITIDFIEWGNMTTWWPAGSVCRCRSCLDIKEATKEEYDKEYTIFSVIDS